MQFLTEMTSQLFRRGHPQLCSEMSFARPTSTAPIPSESSSTSTRSILRVPSLGSTESKEQHQPSVVVYGNNPPVFVNYSSNEDWRGPPPPPRAAYTAPPIRIRSGRGARRQGVAAPVPSYPVSTRGRRKASSSPDPHSKRKLPMASAPGPS